MTVLRNDPCPCGSGKKYKACCAVKRSRSAWFAMVSVSVFAVIALLVLVSVLRDSNAEREIPPGYVWSEEHGHLHRVTAEGPVPATLPPAGSVWSEEHEHYHGPDGRAITWSQDQGVWLDPDGNPLPNP